MAATKKNNFITAELDYAETLLEQWKAYMDANPIDKMEERWGIKEMPKGGHAKVVVATKEQQIKCVQDTLERYLRLLEVVNEMREREEAKKVETRKGSSMNGLMKSQM